MSFNLSVRVFSLEGESGGGADTCSVLQLGRYSPAPGSGLRIEERKYRVLGLEGIIFGGTNIVFIGEVSMIRNASEVKYRLWTRWLALPCSVYWIQHVLNTRSRFGGYAGYNRYHT